MQQEETVRWPSYFTLPGTTVMVPMVGQKKHPYRDKRKQGTHHYIGEKNI